MGSGFEIYRGEMPDGRAEYDEMKNRAEALDKYIEDSLLEGRNEIKAEEEEKKRQAKLERDRKE